MASNNTLLDKYNRGLFVGRDIVSYPFAENDDYTSIVVTCEWRQRESTYYPGRRGVDRHPKYSNAFLIEESSPNPVGFSDLIACRRVYANVPRTQTVYSTISVAKPSPSSFGVARAYRDAIGASLPDNTAYVSGSRVFFGDVLYGPSQSITSNSWTGTANRLTFASPHGVTGANALLIYIPTYPIFIKASTSEYSVISSTVIDVIGTQYSDISAIYSFDRSYSAGVQRVGCRVVSSFYLPGITSGISSPADIPIPATLISDLALFNSIVSGATGYSTYDAKELGKWRGPIYQLDTTEINLSDLA